MNRSTLVVVHGYAGDAHQVRDFLPLYGHHRCPIWVLSPEDSPIVPEDLNNRGRYHITCRMGGKRAYTGAKSLLRQHQHLKMLMDSKEKFFLLNDADSFCVDAEIPQYVYDEPDVFWSNEASDEVGHIMPPGYSYPRLAFQPPYFTSRAVIRALIATHKKTGVDFPMGFIDHYMMRLCVDGGIKHKCFRNPVTCETKSRQGVAHMRDSLRRRGSVFIHSVKTREVADMIVRERAEFLKR